jgi:hypothetical protein
MARQGIAGPAWLLDFRGPDSEEFSGREPLRNVTDGKSPPNMWDEGISGTKRRERAVYNFRSHAPNSMRRLRFIRILPR